MTLSGWIVAAVLCVPPGPEPVNPYPGEFLPGDKPTIISFEQDTGGFRAENQCSLSNENGVLVVESHGNDPYLSRDMGLSGEDYQVEVRLQTSVPGGLAVYWTSGESPGRGEDKSQHFELVADGRWHAYTARIHTPGGFRNLRIDPGSAKGRYEIGEVRVIPLTAAPLVVEQVAAADDAVTFFVRNVSKNPLAFRHGDRPVELPPGERVALREPTAADQPLDCVELNLELPGFPAIARQAVVVHDDAPAQWIGCDVPGEAGLTLEAAQGSNLVRLRRGDAILAVIAPVAAPSQPGRPGQFARLPAFQVQAVAGGLNLSADGIRVAIRPTAGEIRFQIEADELVEGPVVRARGGLEQGLFAGLEYLGKGEPSSSKADIETPEHLRFAPDRLKVTMPLAAFTTDQVGVALSWDDMRLQPTYATPNFVDGTAEHRMSLIGMRYEAFLRLKQEPLEEAVLWAVRRRGLPELPDPPRSPREQQELVLWALTQGPLRNDEGWGHCVEPSWNRQFFADMASTIGRITGEVPTTPTLVPGGGHLSDDYAFFLTGRAEIWAQSQRGRAQHAIRAQQPDGSYRYSGKYLKGHFEDTASGYCALFARHLLEYAYETGDEEALQAGVRTLEYMQRFRTPRGAQTWELSLHTPDILASAHLVAAYVRGYELTGNREYLELARKWAITGIPFVYLWAEHPVMLYATIPVYGATNWIAPNWMGLPVQWCGLVYAYALTMLAPYDATLDWNRLAWGILISGEQQQVPEGDRKAGTLPDSFSLASQNRNGPFINPCALYILRRKLSGEPERPQVLDVKGHRVVVPFPAELRGDRLIIHAQPGVRYQIVIDGGKSIIEIESGGKDEFPIAGLE
ncbi:MAG: hypothetical protein ACUVTW_07300 [Thermogutta sp.]